MASQSFLVHIDLGLNQLQNAVIQPLGSASEPTGQLGRIYYNSDTYRLRIHNGTTWTNVGSIDSVTLTQPSSGVTITNSGNPQIGSASFTFALSDDLAAVEGLSSTGFAVRTGASTWATRTITGNTASGIIVSDGNGVSNNPMIAIDDTIIASRSYVDGLLQGVKWRNSVRVMTTSPLPILGSGSEITPPVVDGISINVTDRVLLNATSNDPSNGVYSYHQDGPTHWSWYRATDLDTWSELISSVVMVEQGTYADTSFVCTVDQGGTLGTTNVTWVKMSKAIGTIDLTTSVTGMLPIANGGTGRSTWSNGDIPVGGTGGTALGHLSIGATGTVLVSSGTAPMWSTLANQGVPKKYSVDCSTATTQTVTHNLGTTDVLVQIWETGNSKRQVIAETRVINSDSISVLFNVAPTSGQYRIIVVG